VFFRTAAPLLSREGGLAQQGSLGRAGRRRAAARGEADLTWIAGTIVWRTLGRPIAALRRSINRRRAVTAHLAATGVAALVLAASGTPAMAGHEVGFYPSYYPHEIRLETLTPARAAELLADKTLYAYIGAEPDQADGLPEHVKALESLGSLVVLSLNPDSPAFGSDEERCAAVQSLLAGLRNSTAPGFVFHPFPVTPYHADYLHYLDRIQNVEASLAAEQPTTNLRIRAKGRHAEALVEARWGLATGDWDVSVEEVPIEDLVTHVQMNAWLEPPWVKEGWFRAYQLLAPGLSDAGAKETADADYRRLLDGEFLDLAEQADLERHLIQALRQGCERRVVGYTVKREFYNDDDSDGVENIAYDSQSGMNTPIFIRTAKLKDYPWNGQLNLGIAQRPQAAWNPVAGFTDPSGRLIWWALGDPGLLPVPYNASWTPNRVDFTESRAEGQSGGIRVPSGSVLPETGSGLLRPLADPTFASVQLTYTATSSPFLDGTDTEVADLLYAFSLAYRWSAQSGPDDRAYDPHLAAATADLRDHLVAIRTLRVEQAVNRIAPDVQIVQNKPVVEIYLKDIGGDPQQVAALAPPWSTIPWHLAALMEEAVVRGLAAFSEGEAERQGVPWLDLVRDASQLEQLQGLIDEFEAAGYRPTALQDLVSEDQARTRWRALREFVEDKGHLLVTNGPYQLKEWQPGSVVLTAVRDATYPMGFGTFDQFVHPLHAVVRETTREDGRIAVRVEVEKFVERGRSYEIKTVPLNRQTARGVIGALVVSRYLLIGSDGQVVDAGKMDWADEGLFVVALPEDLPLGRYVFLAAVYLDGNALTPSIASLGFEIGP
jgi:hypothetical protein